VQRGTKYNRLGANSSPIADPSVKAVSLKRNKTMKVLVACEYSGRVRDAFAKKGHDASKRTCLWLKNLPLLKPTKTIKKARYSNQTPSGQNNLGPSAKRWKIRSETYVGIANAMADQWGGIQ
tara:strand:- start:167 stop:532 length:366 start_codon:yes stop_codon:yes gene_type:complete